MQMSTVSASFALFQAVIIGSLASITLQKRYCCSGSVNLRTWCVPIASAVSSNPAGVRNHGQGHRYQLFLSLLLKRTNHSDENKQKSEKHMMVVHMTSAAHFHMTAAMSRGSAFNRVISACPDWLPERESAGHTRKLPELRRRNSLFRLLFGTGL